MNLADAIRRESRRRHRREQSRARALARERKRFLKRSGASSAKRPTRSVRASRQAWPFSPSDCIRRADYVADGLANALRNGTYKPMIAVRREVPKDGGKTRPVNVFTIPDAALASVVLRRLQRRYAGRLSYSAYAYRTDIGALHAIEHLRHQLTKDGPCYACEIDLAAYFDSISHSYLDGLLERRDIFPLSRVEQSALRQVYRYAFGGDASVWPPTTPTANTAGIPQGHSLSLFLANLACTELDRELESLGVWFARYADDILILSPSYERVSEASRAVIRHARRAGLTINLEKSQGVRQVSKLRRHEIRATVGLDFLGYRVDDSHVLPSEKVIRRIKRRISSILYRNLLYYPRRGFFADGRLDPRVRDWDLVTALNEIRRYLYGRLSEAEITSSLGPRGHYARRSGLLAYFPLVDSVRPWQELDGWLTSVVRRAYARRTSLLASMGRVVPRLTRNDLLTASWTVSTAPTFVEAELPSFVRAWRSCRRQYLSFGLRGFPRRPLQYGGGASGGY